MLNEFPGNISRCRQYHFRISLCNVYVFDETYEKHSFRVYDVVDLLKQYFRELPEPLLTAKYSDTFMNIFTNLPPSNRIEAIQYALLLLPNKHQEALQTLIFFLQDIGQCSNTTNVSF